MVYSFDSFIYFSFSSSCLCVAFCHLFYLFTIEKQQESTIKENKIRFLSVSFIFPLKTKSFKTTKFNNQPKMKWMPGKKMWHKINSNKKKSKKDWLTSSLFFLCSSQPTRYPKITRNVFYVSIFSFFNGNVVTKLRTVCKVVIPNRIHNTNHFKITKDLWRPGWENTTTKTTKQNTNIIFLSFITENIFFSLTCKTVLVKKILWNWILCFLKYGSFPREF